MADSPGSAPDADELQESLPVRDFAGIGGPRDRRTMATVAEALALPPRWSTLPAARAIAVAAGAVAVLLCWHSRREAVAFSVRLRGAAGVATRRVRASVAAAPSFDTLVASLQAVLHDADDAPDPGAPGVGFFVDASSEDGDGESAQADVVLRLDLKSGGCAALAYDPTIFRAGSIEAIASQLAQLLEHALADGGCAPLALRLMSTAEGDRVIRGFNALRVPFPTERTFADLIDEQAARSPDQVCVVHRNEQLTFGELDARAGRLADALARLGAGPGTFVALLHRRGIDFAVALVAIWRTGAAYIPMDPDYPAERVRLMLEDSEVAIAVGGNGEVTRLASLLTACPALRDIVCTDARATSLPDLGPLRLHHPLADGAPPPGRIARRARATDPAYMIYTSGSTGRPKGAIVRHDGAVNHLFAQAHALGRDAVARFLQSAPSSSDISVWQFAAPLALGGTTVVVDDPTDIEHLFAQVRRHGLHVIELVPAVMKHLIDFAITLPAAERELPSLRWAMVTGESAPTALVNAWLGVYPGIPVVNAYGPSEAADDVAQAILREPLPPGQLTVPIGRPLANLDLYVLDPDLRPLPIGVPGEICVAGIGVGDGYWKNPEKTRQAFVPNPFPAAAGPVIYRTGDLGRWRDDGTLECLGRLDHQVQLRGFRIELQEIESVLRQHDGVRDAVVQAFHDGAGDGELVAYVVDAPRAAADDALRAHMARRLPAYMVPGTFVRLEALPLNPAGKVDRRALQRPAMSSRRGAGPLSPPRGAAEAALASIWERELGVQDIGRDDDFFALGGDSLGALAIVVGARAAGWKFRSADVLAHPTVARLAAVAVAVAEPCSDSGLAHEGPATPVVAPLPPAEATAFLERTPENEALWPLAPPQQGMYLHWLLARDKTTYVDQYEYDLFGVVEPAAFEAAWNLVIDRHAALRTAFLRSALGQPAQAVRRQVRIAVEFADLALLPDPDRQASLDALRAAEVARGFDLARPPLMRLTLVRIAPEQHCLVWTHHHIVLDGWSLALVLDEVMLAHEALARGEGQHLPAPVSYGRYVEALARTDITPGLAYWQRALAGWCGAPALRLPEPAVQSRGHGQADVCLDEAITAALGERARRVGVTLTTLLQGAWAALLGGLGGGDDVVFGVVSSGREIAVPGIDAAVGLFVSTLPLRVPLQQPPGDASAWLQDLQRRAAALREHESVPLARIARSCNLEPGRALFDTLFVMSNFPAPAPGRGLLRIEPASFRTVPAYDLSLIVVPAHTLHLRLVYDRTRMDDDGAARSLAAVARLLEGMAGGGDPRRDVGEALEAACEADPSAPRPSAPNGVADAASTPIGRRHGPAPAC